MSADPNGPKTGERALSEKMNALTKVFDARIGPAMPRDDRQHAAEADQFLTSDASLVLGGLWRSVIGKATGQLEGAINLMLFDDRDAIAREIEAAIASVK
jgi:hypothetical protein